MVKFKMKATVMVPGEVIPMAPELYDEGDVVDTEAIELELCRCIGMAFSRRAIALRVEVRMVKQAGGPTAAEDEEERLQSVMTVGAVLKDKAGRKEECRG